MIRDQDQNNLTGIVADRETAGPFVLPLGVPLGLIPPQEGSQSKYLLRRSGEFLVLEEIEYATFCFAQSTPTRKALASQLTAWSSNKVETPDVVVEKLIEHGVLLELSGVWEKDWRRFRQVRVVPRAIALGYLIEPAGSFGLGTPDGTQQLVLDAMSYAIWCRLDGATELSAAVDEAVQDTGFTPGVMQARSEALVVAAMRAGLALLDG